MRNRREFGARVLCFVGMALLAATHAAVATEIALPSSAARSFERFVHSSTPVCLRQPSAACVTQGWAYADTDNDGGLSAGELAAVENAVREWYDWRSGNIPSRDRVMMALGLWIVAQIGLENIAATYDADGDGLITREELLADVRLDERPLGRVLLDADAVDRGAIARRLGAFAPVLGTFLE